MLRILRLNIGHNVETKITAYTDSYLRYQRVLGDNNLYALTSLVNFIIAVKERLARGNVFSAIYLIIY